MIEEREADNKSFLAALKAKSDEAAARDAKYLSDLKNIETFNADQMEKVQTRHLN